MTAGAFDYGPMPKLVSSCISTFSAAELVVRIFASGAAAKSLFGLNQLFDGV